MQTLRKKTSPCKYRNDPGRFFGDGVTFKAKLIGILEVGEARGDKMCQEALQDLKMAIRAAGEHKQRITIHVTIDGLRLRDEKTSDSLYHHPVHKISFIAQDMTDSRAFGYIFGSPDSGHRFFGIKTDKAASQVVLAMRDLFQVVFELKKKEIELARQQIQSKNTNILEHQPSSSSSILPTLLIKSTSSDTSNHAIKNDGAKAYNTKEPNLMSPESVADLVDLEQELSSIQRGITQLDRITPNEPTAAPLASLDSTLEDPFGDSFTNFSSGNGIGSKAYNLLPPPESSRSRHSKPIKGSTDTIATTTSINSTTVTQTSSPPINRSYGYSYNTNVNSNKIITTNTQETENWLNELHQNDVFNESGITSKSKESTTITSSSSQMPNITATSITSTVTTSTPNDEITTIQQTQQLKSDAFTELDPLGTGKIKPYVDKKYFFHELKNPPKKVLKDLSGGMSSVESAGGSFTFTTGQNNPDNDIDEIFETSDSYELSGNSSVNRSTGGGNTDNNNINNCNQTNLEFGVTSQPSPPVMLPRDTDPFSPTRKKSDPFQDGDIFSKLDPFEFEFSKSKAATETKIATTTTNNDNEKLRKESTSPSVFNGPLQVQLPPESSWSTATTTASPIINNIGNSVVHTTIYSDSQYSSPRGRIERQSSESPTSSTRNRPSVFKQNTVDVISSISSKKMPHLFGQKFTKRDSHSINMRRLQESDSLSENETAPEPPPRPDTTGIHHIEPPPLPPKKQFSDIVIRPRITSSSAIQPPPTRYDYVTAKIKSSQLSSMDGSVPPIPLPSRRVGRTDSSFPGPGRPRKPGCDDSGDYLAPLAGRGDVPPLLPPPQTKGRASRRQESLDNKTNVISTTTIGRATPPTTKLGPEIILPDITLSQLLTLGMDDLAGKLNVPPTKLNTMTIVELTTYLSEFLERSKNPKPLTTTVSTKPIQAEEAVFKVNFDQNSDTFIAKFDDNFGEESTNIPFIANFSQFDIKPEPQPIIDTNKPTKSIVPSADRYAVFREIIDQENMKSDSLETDEDEDNDNSSPTQQKLNEFSDDEDDDDHKITDSSFSQITKIDTKITEAISHAKDRYAALRDIILVEDLFEKPTTTIDSNFGDVDFGENIAENFAGQIIESNLENDNGKQECQRNDDSSPDSNQNFLETMESSNEIGELVNKTEIGELKDNNGTLFMHTLTVSSNNKDDLEIDELMNRAISNLSLDSRDHLSPNNQTKSPTVKENVQQLTSPISPSLLQQQQPFRKSPLSNPLTIGKSQFNDVSTSPIPIQQSKSPIPLKSPLVSKSPTNKSPIPQSPAVTNLIGSIGSGGIPSTTKLNNSGSLSDMICGSSSDLDKQRQTSPVASESWAIFDKPNEKKDSLSMATQQQQRLKSPKGPPSSSSNNKDIIGESPCSSDGKDDWKNVGGVGGVGGGGGNRRWPKGQTSSSSRGLSPWDDEATAADYKKRIPPGVVPDRHGYYVRHSKRMNSCDDDYEYEEEIAKRRDRKPKSGMSRSRENFEFDSPNWYQPGMHHSWSPQDEDVRARAFERGVYERSSYGPPIYGDHKPPHSGYDRRVVDYKPGYDKRKYYREYCRPPAADYEFETYGESPDIKDRKMMYGRRDYENIYEDSGGFVRGEVGPRGGGTGIYKSREYFYGGGSGERRSFDRESIESYDSTGRRRKSFGSGEVYGSFDSREEFRERYLGNSGGGGGVSGEKTRSLRMGFKMRGSSAGDDYEQDSENDVQLRRIPADHTRSLQRPGSGTRIRKSSGSSPWDGEEPPPPATSHGPKGWKRPSSASESSERRLAAENRRVLAHTLSGGSDGEKDRRFRKKQRSRGKEGGDQRSAIPNLPPPGSGRFSSNRNDNYDYPYDDYDQSPVSQTPSQMDEDKFERLNRRRHDMNQRMIEAERRKRTGSADKYSYDDDDDDSSAVQKYPTTVGGIKKEIFYGGAEKERYARGKFEIFDEPPQSARQQKTPSTGKSLRSDFDFDDFEEAPRSNTSSNGGGIGGKFNFEEQGFESDFNTSSSPPQPVPPPSVIQTQISSSKSTTKSSFRFSSDFSTEKHHQQQHHSISLGKHAISLTGNNYENDFTPTVTTPAPANSSITPTTTTPSQKLRFDDKVTISKFDNTEPSSCAFDDDDDDFSKAQFNFENEDQWNPNDQPKKNSKRLGSNISGGGIVNVGTNKQYRQQENLRKSESVNIFAKNSDDPFEDDDFFKSTTNNDIIKRNNGNNNISKSQQQSDSFQWDNNFAKFDENM